MKWLKKLIPRLIYNDGQTKKWKWMNSTLTITDYTKEKKENDFKNK